MNKSVLVIYLSVLYTGCTNPDHEAAVLRKENARLLRETDSLRKLFLHAPDRQADSLVRDSTQAGIRDIASGSGALRPGRHDFTLQWISWEEPGSVTILPAEDGWYSIEGSQRSMGNADFIIIKGRLKPVSATELLFEGEVKSVVENNNNGEPCIKTGQQIFKITKNRRYWRMQDMINCEGGMLTDYVDIYF